MMSAFWIRIGRSANQRTVSACHGSRVSATLTTIILIIMITFKAAGCLRHPHTPRYLSPTKMNQQLPSLHMSTLQSSNQAASFKRSNPRGDLYQIESFHHVEFYCGDATSVYKRLTVGLGLELVSKSDQSTGNKEHASYVLQSGNARIICTAPYGGEEVDANSDSNSNSNNVDTQEKHRKDATVLPGFSRDIAVEFFNRHGLAIRAVAIEVADVAIAYDTMLSRGAVSRLSPQIIEDKDQKGFVTIAEVQLYGDVVLRLLDVKHFHGQFLPNFEDVNQRINENIFHGNSTVARPLGASSGVFKIDRFDHVVGNLWSLQPTMGLLKNITGFHEFSEFTAEDVGTVDSGLNSVVLANNNELVLLPINEPTFGTKRKSQIQTYLEQNQGEGVQHIALFTSDILYTLECVRRAELWGGVALMDRPKDSYYINLRNRLGDSLTEDMYQAAEHFGILVDKDDQGILLQIFTKPLGDRSTFFFEIIQRIGCDEDGKPQRPGCGGFGKGNFKDLFKSIEDYEKKLNL